jgi:hypothetical protein
VDASAAAAAGSAPAKDRRPWPVRNPISTVVLTLAGTWAYTLWVGSKTRSAQDDVEEAVRSRYPINEDEVLELRALNDAQTAMVAELPAAAAASGRAGRVRADELLQLLRRLIGRGEPLKEEYALERMVMALPDGPPYDVHVVAAGLTILSTGPVAERLSAMFELLAGDDGAVRAERFAALLRTLMATGQLPPEKFVHTVDEGRHEQLRIERSWYRIPPVREWTAEEWTELLLEQTAAEGVAEEGERSAERARVIDLDRFQRMLTSETVCLWGECDRIRERLRMQQKREEDEEYERNPPFYAKAWRAIRGTGGAAPPAEAA